MWGFKHQEVVIFVIENHLIKQCLLSSLLNCLLKQRYTDLALSFFNVCKHVVCVFFIITEVEVLQA